MTDRFFNKIRPFMTLMFLRIQNDTFGKKGGVSIKRTKLLSQIFTAVVLPSYLLGERSEKVVFVMVFGEFLIL